MADDADVGQPDGLVHDAPQVLRELVQAVLIHHGGHLAEAHGGAEGVLRHLADVVGVTQRGPSIQSAVNGAQLQGLIDLCAGDVGGRGPQRSQEVAPHAQSADLFAVEVLQALYLEVCQDVVVGLMGIPVVFEIQFSVGLLDHIQQPIVLHYVIDFGGALPCKGDAAGQIRLRNQAGEGGAEDDGTVKGILREIGQYIGGLAQSARLIQLHLKAAIGSGLQSLLQVGGHIALQGIQ
ncbi:hypothetical protein GOGPGP_GOGPGP_10320, partial [Dysosmobacter welbionis]